MLIVVNPRIDPEATLSGWAKHNARLIVVTLLWIFTLLLIAGTQLGTNGWSRASLVDGAIIYSTYATEEECDASVSDGNAECEPPSASSRR